MRHLVFPLILFLLIGCTPRKHYNTPLYKEIPQVQGSELPTDSSKKTGIDRGDRIGPLDVLEIRVYQEPGLDRVVRVSQDGYISFTLICSVRLDTLTVREAESRIESQLGKDFLVNPQVTIFVKEHQNKKISVLGQVKKPGSYELPQGRNLTVIEAVALAGGFTDIAAVSKTKVIRIEDGVQRYIEVNVSDIIKRGDKTKNIILKPDDIIFVPESIF